MGPAKCARPHGTRPSGSGQTGPAKRAWPVTNKLGQVEPAMTSPAKQAHDKWALFLASLYDAGSTKMKNNENASQKCQAVL